MLNPAAIQVTITAYAGLFDATKTICNAVWLGKDMSSGPEDPKKRGGKKRAKQVAEAARSVDATDITQKAFRPRVKPTKRPSDVFLGEFRRRDVFPLLILHFCSTEPSYGNNLISQIEELTSGIMSVNPNTIYPLLRELEAKGFIEGQWEHPEKRSRRFYSITDEGKEEHKRLRSAVKPFLDAIVQGVKLIEKEIYG